MRSAHSAGTGRSGARVAVGDPTVDTRSDVSGPLVVPGANPAPVPRRLSRPRWWDPRIVGGLLLVVVAVVVGAKVIGASTRTSPIWAATHDLAAGTVLTSNDLVAVDVNLGGQTGEYLLAATGTDAVAGRLVSRPVHGGELLPAAALTAPAAGRVLVIGVSADRMPPGVTHGSVIDLYLTAAAPGGGSGVARESTTLISAGITVQGVVAPASGGLSGATSNRYQVAVLLDPATADKLVRALPTGDPTVVLVSGK